MATAKAMASTTTTTSASCCSPAASSSASSSASGCSRIINDKPAIRCQLNRPRERSAASAGTSSSKVVRFDAQGIYHTTHWIESHQDLTDDEIESIWYTPEEYSRFRSKIRCLQRRLKQNGPHNNAVKGDDDKDVCFRGIIHGEFRAKRMAYRKQALESLLYEQQRQKLLLGSSIGAAPCCYDDEKIRSVLVLCTQAAVEEAIVRAEEDRRSALGILKKWVIMVPDDEQPTRTTKKGVDKKTATAPEVSSLASALVVSATSAACSSMSYNQVSSCLPLHQQKTRRGLFEPVSLSSASSWTCLHDEKTDLVALLDDALAMLE